MTSEGTSWSAYRPNVLPPLSRVDAGRGRVVLVAATEAARSAGWAPEIALGLARSWAGIGADVVVIDADPMNPTLHRLAHVDNGTGISDALLFGSSIGGMAMDVEDGRFRLVPAGSPLADPVGAFGRPRWIAVLDELLRAESTVLVYGSSECDWMGALAMPSSDVVLLAAPDDPGAVEWAADERLRAVYGVGTPDDDDDVDWLDPLASDPLASDPLRRSLGDDDDFRDPLADDDEPAALPSAEIDDQGADLDEAGIGSTGGLPEAEEAVTWEPPVMAEPITDPLEELGGTTVEDEGEPRLEPATAATPQQVEDDTWETADEALRDAAPDFSLDASPPGRPLDEGPLAPPSSGRRSGGGVGRWVGVAALVGVLGGAWWAWGLLGPDPEPTSPVQSEPPTAAAPTTPVAEGVSADPAPAQTEPAPVEAAPGLPTGPELRFLAAFGAFGSAETAFRLRDELRAAAPDASFMVVPVEVSGRVFHRVLGRSGDPEGPSSAMMAGLAQATGRSPDDLVLREVPMAFHALATRDVDEARASSATLAAEGLPAYVLSGDAQAGDAVYHVLVGAFLDENEASYLEGVMTASNRTFPLVTRRGTPIG